LLMNIAKLKNLRNVNMLPVKIEKQAFIAYKKACDGICAYCKQIAWSIAAPLDENKYCAECENKGVVGMDVALKLGLIEILEEGRL
jgi:hypothetical protein